MNNITITTKSSNVWRAHVSPGSDIESACKEAILIASEKSVTVTFDFNGVEIVATGGKLATALVEQYRSECDGRARAWAASEAGQKAKANEIERLNALQAEVDALLGKLDTVIGSEVQLVKWVGRFAELNDHIGLRLDKALLATKLEVAGYKDNAEVGKSPREIQADKSMMARYIVGQAINCLRSDMPIHPMASKFASDYAIAA